LDFAFEALVEDVHNHEQAASEAGKLGADEDVAFLQFGEHGAEFAFFRLLGTGNRFLNPVVDDDVLPLAKAVDFIALVFNGLFVGADADVAVVHTRMNIAY